MNKPLKQIYINLFYSLESISKKTYIIDEILINYFLRYTSIGDCL